MDGTRRQKINKETEEQPYKPDLTDFLRTFHPTTERTFFSGAHGTVFRMDHMLGHKRSLDKTERRKSYKVCFPTTRE